MLWWGWYLLNLLVLILCTGVSFQLCVKWHVSYSRVAHEKQWTTSKYGACKHQAKIELYCIWMRFYTFTSNSILLQIISIITTTSVTPIKFYTQLRAVVGANRTLFDIWNTYMYTAHQVTACMWHTHTYMPVRVWLPSFNS